MRDFDLMDFRSDEELYNFLEAHDADTLEEANASYAATNASSVSTVAFSVIGNMEAKRSRQRDSLIL